MLGSLTSKFRPLRQAFTSFSRRCIATDVYRHAMRGLCSPVSVVTCRNNETGASAGMTISSLCSVSLHPDPVVSFNIHVPSRTADVLKQSKGLCAINILGPSAQHIQIAQAFAGTRGDINPFSIYPEYFSSHHGVPVVQNAGSVLLCEISTTLAVQDHELAVAKVHDVILGDGRSLIYQHGKFRSVGEELDRNKSR